MQNVYIKVRQALGRSFAIHAIAAALALLGIGAGCAPEMQTDAVGMERFGALQYISPAAIEPPVGGFVVSELPEDVLAMAECLLTVNGRPVDGSRIELNEWADDCEWLMPTLRPGKYDVSLHVISGGGRAGRFGYYFRRRLHQSNWFSRQGKVSGLSVTFRIAVPEGQTQTRMRLTGNGIQLKRVDISPVTDGQDATGELKIPADSSYRTVLAWESADLPACVVLAPLGRTEARLARELGNRLGLPVADEPGLCAGLPAPPRVEGVEADTNLILLAIGKGGPLTIALRRAGLIAENEWQPGPGGFTIRVVPRPFTSRANVIVISAGDEESLSRGINEFLKQIGPADHEIVYDRFLIDSPGPAWLALRNRIPAQLYDPPADLEAWLVKAHSVSGRAMEAWRFVRMTADCGDRYWLTGDLQYAELFRRFMDRMIAEDMFEPPGNRNCHLALGAIIRAWDRVEEAEMFSPAERLRIANYLLKCIESAEGFARAYSEYDRYAGRIQIRQNHQTALGLGLLQAHLYFLRQHQLGRSWIWKSWCDDLIVNGSAWGHAAEDSAVYQQVTFTQIAQMIRAQGLSVKDHKGTSKWLDAARHMLAVRDNFGLLAAYGDCFSSDSLHGVEFFAIMRDDFGWAGGQFLLDRIISGFKETGGGLTASEDFFVWSNGSTDVGGDLPPADPETLKEVQQDLLGLVVLPLAEPYWRYLTGQLGNEDLWNELPLPPRPEYSRTADKIQYRSGWEPSDEYLLVEGMGWANHGHLDLGSIVHYTQGGRVWIVDNGYDNEAPRHHSTIEIIHDGQPAWGPLTEQNEYRWGDFRGGPQLIELTEVHPTEAGIAGAFRFAFQIEHMAGATWRRTISGGGGGPLVVEDVITAEEPGQYDVYFRLRLLGTVEGDGQKWIARQIGASLPVYLDAAASDDVQAFPAELESFAREGGAFPWYRFAINGDGQPKVLEWHRSIALESGQSTTFRAILGPVESNQP